MVVTPEELRKHGIDRVRIIPQARALPCRSRSVWPGQLALAD